MPSNVVKTGRDEHLWSKAKAIARKKKSEGSDEFYAYTMGIYQQMKGNKAMEPIMLKAHIKAHQRQVAGRTVNVREHEDSRQKRKAADNKYSLAVAHTIQKQIGRQALYMIGAKGYGAGTHENGDAYLQFRIARNSSSIHMIRITLNAMDTYDVEFGRITKGPTYRKVSDVKGVYNDMLKDVIELHTGLATSLGTMGKGMMLKAKVVAHIRHYKSGKVAQVREHHKTIKPGQSGYKSAHPYGGTAYFRDMAGHHKARMAHHDEQLKRHKKGSAKYEHHWGRSAYHEGEWEMNMTDAGDYKKSMESDMKGLEKYPLLEKAVGTVKQHQRRTKSGKVAIVREHQVQHRGQENRIPLEDRIGMRKWANEYFQQFKAGNKKGAADTLANLHKKGKEFGLSSTQTEGYLGIPQFRAAQRSVKKSIEGEAMNEINMDQYPDLQKAVEIGSLSKSLEFTKTGADIRMGIMVKIGQCQGDLLRAVAEWQAGLEPKYTNNMDTVKPAAEDDESPPREPFPVRGLRTKIEKLDRIARNLEPKKKYKLSEYDLHEYGM